MLIRLPHRPWIHAGRPIPGTTLVKSLCGGLKGQIGAEIILANPTETSDTTTHCIKCVWLTQVWLHQWEPPPVVTPPDISLPRRTVELYLRYQDCRPVADHLKAEGYMLPNGNNIQPT